MAFNPNFHNRQSIRLKSYDYSKVGVYSFTICVENRRCLLGEIQNGEMILSPLGNLIENEWYDLQNRFQNISLDEFVIMPNHIHGIIIIKKAESNIESKGSTNIQSAENEESITKEQKTTTLGEVIGSFKSLVYSKHLKASQLINPDIIVGKLWQRNYFERIIWNNEDLDIIRKYIRHNPENWENDELK